MGKHDLEAKLHPLARPAFKEDTEEMTITSTLTSHRGIGDVVTDLFEATNAPVIVVFASTKRGFEGFHVYTLENAREAGEHMSPGMRRAIEEAPRVPIVRIFYLLSSGEITFRDLPALRLDVDMSGAPS